MVGIFGVNGRACVGELSWSDGLALTDLKSGTGDDGVSPDLRSNSAFVGSR